MEQEPKSNTSHLELAVAVGIVLPLLQWGLHMIGVDFNPLLGVLVLAIAFIAMVYAFGIWERSSKWNKALKVGAVISLAIVYFGLIDYQVKTQGVKGHTRPPSLPMQTEGLRNDRSVSEPEVQANTEVSPATTRTRRSKTIAQCPAENGVSGTDNTQVNDSRAINGNGNTIVGPNDSHGNTIFNQSGITIGNGAQGCPNCIVIGAHARSNSTPASSVSCSGSGPCAGINNGTQIGTLNQYGVSSLSMTDAQYTEIRDAMKPYAGMSFFVQRINETQEVQTFADRLEDALEKAGMVDKSAEPDAIRSIHPYNIMPSGVSLALGNNYVQVASTLALKMKALGLISKTLQSQYSSDPDTFIVYVAPNR